MLCKLCSVPRLLTSTSFKNSVQINSKINCRFQGNSRLSIPFLQKRISVSHLISMNQGTKSGKNNCRRASSIRQTRVHHISSSLHKKIIKMVSISRPILVLRAFRKCRKLQWRCKELMLECSCSACYNNSYSTKCYVVTGRQTLFCSKFDEHFSVAKTLLKN